MFWIDDASIAEADIHDSSPQSFLFSFLTSTANQPPKLQEKGEIKPYRSQSPDPSFA
jgi:hypothetical protein